MEDKDTRVIEDDRPVLAIIVKPGKENNFDIRVIAMLPPEQVVELLKEIIAGYEKGKCLHPKSEPFDA